MKSRVPPAVAWSCCLYGRLLALLPRSFRQDYDQPVQQAFNDVCRDAWQAHGPLGLVNAWVQALPDLADGIAGEWQLALTFGGFMERKTMRTSLLIALVICAILLAVLAFPPLPIPTRNVVELLILVGIISGAISGWRNRRSQPVAAEGTSLDLIIPSSGSGTSAWIRSLLVGLELIFLVLFVYTFRVVFTSVPKFEALQHIVIDPRLMNAVYNFRVLLVAVILLGTYLAMTLFGTRSRETSARPWMVGVIAGSITGLAMALLALAGQLNAPSQVLVTFITALLAGLVAGKLAEQTEAGALGGFWCGLACALVWSTAEMVIDLTFSSHLAATAWYATHLTCLGLSGYELEACAVGQDYTIWGRVLLELPILSGALGVIGGFLGAALTKPRQLVAARWGRALLAPVMFCGVMMILLVVVRTTGWL